MGHQIHTKAPLQELYRGSQEEQEALWEEHGIVDVDCVS